jgi:hypothetical protein
VVYGLSTVGAAIAAQDEVQFLWPMMVYPFRASQAEGAMAPFLRHIPGWMVPQEPAVVEPYYAGRTNFWDPAILGAWLAPIGAWMAWLGALGATMWAWNVILRRRWVEHDKLSFPCVQLPLEMCRAGALAGAPGGNCFGAGSLPPRSSSRSTN